MQLARQISLVYSLIHVPVLFSLLYRSRLSRRLTAILTPCLVLVVLLINTAVFLGNAALSELWMIVTCTLPCMLFFLPLAKHRDGRFFFTFFLVSSICCEVIILSALTDTALFGGNGVFSVATRLLAFPLLTLLTWRYVRHRYLDAQDTLRLGWGFFAVVSAVFYLLFVLLAPLSAFPVKRPWDVPIVLVCCVLLPLSYITISRFLQEQRKAFRAQEAERESLQQFRILQSELDTEKMFVLNAKRFRHDLRHHSALIMTYLNLGDVEGAKAYLAEYDRAISESTLENYCENHAVNAIIRMTARHCQLHNIDFACAAEIPAQLPLSVPETGALFGNLLENAREACDACPAELRRLHIRAEVRDRTLYLQLENSVGGEVLFENDLPVTTKSDGGVGVPSMKLILEEHGGMLSFSQREHLFFSRIILPLSS